MKTRYLLFLLCWPLAAAAQTHVQPGTMYVSDQLRITVRTGQGNQHRIIKTLKSGDKVEVLEATDTGYAFVRTADGTEGWVRSQYLVAEPIARDRLAAAKARLERLGQRVATLRENLAEVKAERARLQQENAALTRKVAALEKQVEHLNQVAARPIQLDKENKRLKEQNLQLENDLQLKIRENQVLKDRSDREWFVIGAAVLLGGILLGLILPKLRIRRRSSWDL